MDLPTMGVGSYAAPGWLFLFREAMRAGRTGAEDVEEAFDDATRIAIADQIEAGVDILSDGELRRSRFVYEMYDRLTGIERVPAGRRLGVPGYDRAPNFTARERVAAPGGLGIAAEFRRLRELAPGRRLKVAFPGPLTFMPKIAPEGPYSGDRAALLDDIAGIVRDELDRLAGEGAELIQIDEPGFTDLSHGMDSRACAEAVNSAVAGHADRVAVHICFGNNASRPYSPRGFARLLPGMAMLDCSMLVLEFANREMADLDALPALAERYRIAAGVIDVKSFHIETPEEVAGRLERVLEVVPRERLWVTADCGFSALPRWLAREKLRAMVAGTRLVRGDVADQAQPER